MPFVYPLRGMIASAAPPTLSNHNVATATASHRRAARWWHRWPTPVTCLTTSALRHWSKAAWQNMVSLLAVVGYGPPHSMPQGGEVTSPDLQKAAPCKKCKGEIVTYFSPRHCPCPRGRDG